MTETSTINLLTNKDIIVFGEDFSRHPHSLEHLLKPLFHQNRFIWVETLGLRSPVFSIYDLKKISLKILRWLKPLNQINKKPDSIHILKPFMIPYNQFLMIRKFNQISVLRSIRKEIKKLNFKSDLTITSRPDSCDYVNDLKQKKIIYICVDEYALWPGFNSKMIQNMEQKLLQKSDLVFATSTNLQKNKSNQKTETRLLTHGVDFEYFKLPEKKINPEKIKICYFGLFDQRSDQNILKYIADEIKNVEIHIIGDVACDIKILKNNSKIIFHKTVFYKGLPEKITDMDIFILPYKKNDLTKNINPLKLKEYLATGRAVISTSIPEVLNLKDQLFLADTGPEFKKVIEQILSGDLKKAHEFNFENQSWTSKAIEFSKAINDL